MKESWTCFIKKINNSRFLDLDLSYNWTSVDKYLPTLHVSAYLLCSNAFVVIYNRTMLALHSYESASI